MDKDDFKLPLCFLGTNILGCAKLQHSSRFYRAASWAGHTAANAVFPREWSFHPEQQRLPGSLCMSRHPQPQPGQCCLLSQALLLILLRPDTHWHYHQPSCKRKNQWPGRVWHQELALLPFVYTAMNSLLGISKGGYKEFQSTFCLQCCDRTQDKYIKSHKTNLLPYISPRNYFAAWKYR